MIQSSEWGMRCLQGPFPRPKERFIYEEKGERDLMLKLIVLIYNFRVNTVGINQIRNTYMPWLEEEATDFLNCRACGEDSDEGRARVPTRDLGIRGLSF